MKVCIIGGTGLLGSEGARELIARGHQVKTIARREPSKVRDCLLKWRSRPEIT